MTLTIVLRLYDDATNVWSDRELPIADCVGSDQVIDIALKHAEMDDLTLTHIRATSPFVTSFQPVQVFRQRLHREYRLRRIGEYGTRAHEAMEGMCQPLQRMSTIFAEFMERARELGLADSATTPPPLRNDPTPQFPRATTPPPRYLYVAPNGSSWFLGGPAVVDSATTPPPARCTLELFSRPLAGMSRDAANAMRAALRADQLDDCEDCAAYQRGQRNMNRPWINRLDGRR